MPDDGQVTRSELGAVQGGCIGPLLANIYLHYALDLWVEQWRARHARGDVIGVRYADDGVAGLQHRGDAERLRARGRAAAGGQFGLQLHPDKTRLIEFGRCARENRSRRRQGNPRPSTCLGLRALLRPEQQGQVQGLEADQCQAAAGQAARGQGRVARGRMQRPIAEQGQYLRAVVTGHTRCFAVPRNGARVQACRFQVLRRWHRTLCRRSQGKHLSCKRMYRIVDHWLPCPRTCHPYPTQRLIVTARAKSRVR